MLVGGWKYVEVCWKYVAGMSIGGFEGIYNQQIWYLMIIWLVQPIQGWLVVSNTAGKPSTSRLFAG